MRKCIYTSVVNFALAAGRTARATWQCHYVYMCANNFTLTTNYYTFRKSIIHRVSRHVSYALAAGRTARE